MVSEFSSFARMPEPVMELDNLSRHIKEAIFLHKQAHRDIAINYREVAGREFPGTVRCATDQAGAQ
jgi:two-component system nitrogen regulation sensor histidine kinase NtrY